MLDHLYDRDSMPPVLRRAHDAHDRAVDRLYRRSGIRFERERVEHLSELSEREFAPLDTMVAKRPRRRRAAAD